MQTEDGTPRLRYAAVRIPRPREHARASAETQLIDAVAAATAAADAARAETQALRAELATARSEAEQTAAGLTQELERQRAILQSLHDREPEMRERLAALRAAPEYELAFTEAEPLVSVIVPTYDRGDLLASRAIPSILAQTHQRFEVIVVGDAAPDSTRELIDEIDDPRIEYWNLNRRGPYPEDRRELWHVAGIPPRNAAAARARGRWIAPLDDDDAFTPDHIERLLAFAQRDRHEVTYGRLRCLMNDGSQFDIGEFPPRYGQFGWQGAIFHAGLRTFEMELSVSLFGLPGDWSLCRRMLRAGVRFGMLDEVVTDHYESRMSGEA